MGKWANISMEKKTSKFKLLIVIILSIFLISLIVFFYVNQFGHSGLSNKTQDWANFSSYIGGLLTPIITSFTIFFLEIYSCQDFPQ